MRGQLVVTYGVAAVIGLLAGCSSSGKGGAGALGTPDPTPAATATATATVTATATATVTATASAPAKLTTPEAAAKHLYNAWMAGDKTTAGQGAASSAVTALFAKTWKTGTYFFGGCSTATQCQYNYATGAIMMTISGSASAGYVVTNVEFGSAG
jgi:hypothetical protein